MKALERLFCLLELQGLHCAVGIESHHLNSTLLRVSVW